MSEKIDRRKFLKGASVGSLSVLALGGLATTAKAQTSEPASKKQPHYALVFDQNKCIGCGLCVTTCNEVNELPPGQSRLLLERQMVDGRRRYVRVSCQQCEDAPCVQVCPTAAAHYDPVFNVVTMDIDRCVGCKYCIAACPYNVRFINQATLAADNCDFCLQNRLSKGEDPGCVSACRHDALVFGDLNDENSYINKLLAVKDSVRIRPYLGTRPSLRYIPIVKKGV